MSFIDLNIFVFVRIFCLNNPYYYVIINISILKNYSITHK